MTEEELFYGKNGAVKMRLLKDGLINIENQYLDYFENKPPKRAIEKHDRLCNHYSLTTTSNGANFGFYASSDLKEEIKIECHKLFDEIFNPEN